MRNQGNVSNYANFYGLCRLCLSENSLRVNLFDEEARRRELNLKIENLLSVYVKEDDCLPRYICYDCVIKIEALDEYKVNCNRAEHILKAWMPSGLRRLEIPKGEHVQSSMYFPVPRHILDFRYYEGNAFILPVIKIEEEEDEDGTGREEPVLHNNTNNITIESSHIQSKKCKTVTTGKKKIVHRVTNKQVGVGTHDPAQTIHRIKNGNSSTVFTPNIANVCSKLNTTRSSHHNEVSENIENTVIDSQNRTLPHTPTSSDNDRLECVPDSSTNNISNICEQDKCLVENNKGQSVSNPNTSLINCALADTHTQLEEAQHSSDVLLVSVNSPVTQMLPTSSTDTEVNEPSTAIETQSQEENMLQENYQCRSKEILDNTLMRKNTRERNAASQVISNLNSTTEPETNSELINTSALHNSIPSVTKLKKVRVGEVAHQENAIDADTTDIENSSTMKEVSLQTRKKGKKSNVVKQKNVGNFILGETIKGSDKGSKPVISEYKKNHTEIIHSLVEKSNACPDVDTSLVALCDKEVALKETGIDVVTDTENSSTMKEVTLQTRKKGKKSNIVKQKNVGNFILGETTKGSDKGSKPVISEYRKNHIEIIHSFSPENRNASPHAYTCLVPLKETGIDVRTDTENSFTMKEVPLQTRKKRKKSNVVKQKNVGTFILEETTKSSEKGSKPIIPEYRKNHTDIINSFSPVKSHASPHADTSLVALKETGIDVRTDTENSSTMKEVPSQTRKKRKKSNVVKQKNVGNFILGETTKSSEKGSKPVIPEYKENHTEIIHSFSPENSNACSDADTSLVALKETGIDVLTDTENSSTMKDVPSQTRKKGKKSNVVKQKNVGNFILGETTKSSEKGSKPVIPEYKENHTEIIHSFSTENSNASPHADTRLVATRDKEVALKETVIGVLTDTENSSTMKEVPLQTRKKGKKSNVVKQKNVGNFILGETIKSTDKGSKAVIPEYKESHTDIIHSFSPENSNACSDADTSLVALKETGIDVLTDTENSSTMKDVPSQTNEICKKSNVVKQKNVGNFILGETTKSSDKGSKPVILECKENHKDIIYSFSPENCNAAPDTHNSISCSAGRNVSVFQTNKKVQFDKSEEKSNISCTRKTESYHVVLDPKQPHESLKETSTGGNEYIPSSQHSTIFVFSPVLQLERLNVPMTINIHDLPIPMKEKSAKEVSFQKRKRKMKTSIEYEKKVLRSSIKKNATNLSLNNDDTSNSNSSLPAVQTVPEATNSMKTNQEVDESAKRKYGSKRETESTKAIGKLLIDSKKADNALFSSKTLEYNEHENHNIKIEKLKVIKCSLLNSMKANLPDKLKNTEEESFTIKKKFKRSKSLSENPQEMLNKLEPKHSHIQISKKNSNLCEPCIDHSSNSNEQLNDINEQHQKPFLGDQDCSKSEVMDKSKKRKRNALQKVEGYGEGNQRSSTSLNGKDDGIFSIKENSVDVFTKSCGSSRKQNKGQLLVERTHLKASKKLKVSDESSNTVCLQENKKHHAVEKFPHEENPFFHENKKNVANTSQNKNSMLSDGDFSENKCQLPGNTDVYKFSDKLEKINPAPKDEGNITFVKEMSLNEQDGVNSRESQSKHAQDLHCKTASNINYVKFGLKQTTQGSGQLDLCKKEVKCSSETNFASVDEKNVQATSHSGTKDRLCKKTGATKLQSYCKRKNIQDAMTKQDSVSKMQRNSTNLTEDISCDFKRDEKSVFSSVSVTKNEVSDSAEKYFHASNDVNDSVSNGCVARNGKIILNSKPLHKFPIQATVQRASSSKESVGSSNIHILPEKTINKETRQSAVPAVPEIITATGVANKAETSGATRSNDPGPSSVQKSLEGSSSNASEEQNLGSEANRPEDFERLRSKPYECHLCNKSFPTLKCLITHSLSHSGSEHNCKMCSNTFSMKSLLRSHMKQHLEEKFYYCRTCDKTFSSEASLKTHMRLHAREKSHECNFCDKNSVNREVLRMHSEIHDAEKLHVCKMCGHNFNTSSDLQSHVCMYVRILKNDRLFKCEYCNAKFNTDENLKEHCKTHASPKVYRCSLCNEMFFQSSEFRNHIKSHIYP